MGNSDASHYGNVVSFDELTNDVKGYNSGFNPANPLFKIPALEAKSASAHSAIANCNATFTAYNKAVEIRKMVYLPLDNLITRIFNFVKSSGASQIAIDQVATIVRKQKGQRAGKKLPVPEKSATVEGPVQISVSQVGFNDQLNNFEKLIKQLELITEYVPNESDLIITALKSLWTALDSANKAVLNAENNLSNARIARNTELYTPVTGLTSIGQACKVYIKAAFGAKSPQYLQVAKIRFRTYKN